MKVRVYVSTGYVGSKKEEIIEIEDGLTEEQMEETCREIMFEMIDWGFQILPENS